MPSNLVTNTRTGGNLINASVSGNIIRSIVKGDGTSTILAPNYRETPVASPDTFTHSSNSFITTSMATGSGPLASGLHLAVGSAVGTGFTIRRESEIGVSNLNSKYVDPVHDKSGTRELSVTGLIKNVYGQWVNPVTNVTYSGTTTVPTVSGSNLVNGASNDTAVNTRSVGQEYYYKMGTNDVDKALEARKD